MAILDRITIAKDLLIDRIENILGANLNFLLRLSPEELGMLVMSVERVVDFPENHIRTDLFPPDQDE
jgi:hypothetical protein